jgi:hypothetical protein
MCLQTVGVEQKKVTFTASPNSPKEEEHHLCYTNLIFCGILKSKI